MNMKDGKQYVRARVVTEAKREKVEKKKGVFFIEVKEKAEQGKANARVRTVLATTLGCAEKELRLIKGAQSTSKMYLLAN